MFDFENVRFDVCKVVVIMIDKVFGSSVFEISEVVVFFDEREVKVILVVVGFEDDLF